MSLLDKYIQFKATASRPVDTVTRRFIDPNFLTPDEFFMMDEIKGRQILRKYDKGNGMPLYLGTYMIIFKTEDLGKFCLIMKRIKNEWRVPAEYVDESETGADTFIVAEYYPGTHSRIYLKGLGAPAVQRIVKKYERKARKKLTG
ncbi:MAG: hypothetical protein Q4A65_05950 [Bacillota bacterium]|nr:hypothetical protein [Bacillota bacterium]